MFGREYVVDHCVDEFQKNQKQEGFRIYVTDALKAMGHLDRRFIDAFKPVETRSADEIKLRITDKLKGL